MENHNTKRKEKVEVDKLPSKKKQRRAGKQEKKECRSMKGKGQSLKKRTWKIKKCEQQKCRRGRIHQKLSKLGGKKKLREKKKRHKIKFLRCNKERDSRKKKTKRKGANRENKIG